MRSFGPFTPYYRRFRQIVSISLIALLAPYVTSCAVAEVVDPPQSSPLAATQPTAASSPAVDRWAEIQRWTPYPHTTPLPPEMDTPVDGVYVRRDPRDVARPPCRRCPPYPPEGGLWKLQLEDGIFRIYHSRTGWRTLGSYSVAGNQITFFNDPQCHLAVGVFAWALVDEALHLQLVEDDCELGTRAKNLTAQPWRSCQPPNHEAGVTGHWSAPEGCDE